MKEYCDILIVIIPNSWFDKESSNKNKYIKKFNASYKLIALQIRKAGFRKDICSSSSRIALNKYVRQNNSRTILSAANNCELNSAKDSQIKKLVTNKLT